MKFIYILLLITVELFASNLHKVSLIASLGITHDDNIYNNTFEPETNYGSIVLHNDTNTVSDNYINKLLYANDYYKMPDYKDIKWDNTLVLFHRNGMKYSNQNILYGSFATGPVVTKHKYTIKSQIFLGNLNYAGEQYMYMYGIGIKISRKFFDKKLNTNSVFLVKKDRYFKDENKMQDDKVFLCAFNLSYKINKNNILNYTFSYSMARKEFGDSISVDKNNYSYGVKYNKKFYSNYKLTVGATIKKEHYIDADPILGTRNDTTTYCSGGISKKFKKLYSLSLKYGYTKNKSSINFYSYKKNTFTVTVSRLFSYP